MELCHNPALATEITLQPLKKFNLDAAILFCDILVTAEALGSKLDIVEKKGPVIANPITCRQDLQQLLKNEEALHALDFVATTLGQLRRELGANKALLGFAGAPFTVACYMIEGGSSVHITRVFRMIQEEPQLFHDLLERLTDLTIGYVHMQRRNGVDAVQIFESWASLLPQDVYLRAVMPHLQRLLQAIHDPQHPTILFALAGRGLWEKLLQLPVQAASVGPNLDLHEFSTLAHGKCLQGNLDPRWLLCPQPRFLEQAGLLLATMRGRSAGYIFNLGHGILQQTPEDHVRALVDLVSAGDVWT